MDKVSKWQVAAGGNSSIAPNQPASEEEWTPEEYAANIRFYISRGYNQNIYSSSLLPDINLTPFKGQNLGYNYQYIKSVSYIFGAQFGTEFDFVSKDSNNDNTKIPMWRGLDIRSVFNYFSGQCRAKFQNIPRVLQAKGISENIISKKKLKLDVTKRLNEAKHFIDREKELNGIQIDFERDYLNLSELQETERYFRSFTDSMERAYRNIGKDFLLRNNFLTLLLKASDYCFLGARSIINVYESKGRIYMRVIPPQNAIVDMSQDDDQHYKDNFAGSIEAFSIPELLSMDEYTKEEIELLQNLATSSPNIPIGSTGFVWANTYNNVPKVWRANVEWRSVTYVDGVPLQCIRQGVLVGDILLKNCKIKKDSINDKYDKSQKELDHLVFTPFTFLNSNMSVVMMVRNLLDLKSMLMTKMTELFARGKGKIPFLDTSKFPSFMKTPEILAQIEQQGILVGNRAEAEEGATKSNKMLEVLDFTLDSGIPMIMNTMQYLDDQIGQIINMPKYAIQGSGQYQSANQTENNVQSSDIGTSWLYGGLQTFFLRVIDHAVRKTILVTSEQDKEYLALNIGDAEAELLSKQEIQDMLTDAFQLYLSMNNELTEQVKATASQIILNNASINPNALLEYIGIMECETTDDARILLEKERLRREKAELAKMEADRAAAERNATINANAMKENTAMQTQAALEKAQMDNETKLLDTIKNETQR